MHLLPHRTHACGRSMPTGRDGVEVQAVCEPISLGEARVAAGDYILGDLEGIVVMPPPERALEAFERALTLRAPEHRTSKPRFPALRSSAEGHRSRDRKASAELVERADMHT